MRQAASLLEPEHWRLLTILGTVSFFDDYCWAVVMVALPQIRVAFHLSQASAALWVGVLYLGAIPGVFLSRRADRAGRRPLLVACIVLATLATGATALAPGIVAFASLQFVARLFLGAEVGIAWTMVAEELPAGARGFGFGWLATSSALGSGACALVWAVGLAPFGISWRWLYLIALPVLLYALRARRTLRETKRFAALELSGRMSRSWREILRPPHRRFVLLIGAAGLFGTLTTQPTLFAVDFMETQHHLSPSGANLTLIASGALALPVLVLAGALSDRYGRRRTSVSFLSLYVIGIIGFFVAARGEVGLFFALAFLYVGQFGAWPTLGAFGTELFPTRLRALGGSAAAAGKLTGNCVSFVIAAGLLTLTGSFGTAAALLAAGPLLAAILVATMFPETGGRELEELTGEEALATALR